MESLDWKTVLDAGGLGVLVFVLWMSGKRIDRLHDTVEAMFTRLIDIIAQDTAERRMENTRRQQNLEFTGRRDSEHL